MDEELLFRVRSESRVGVGVGVGIGVEETKTVRLAPPPGLTSAGVLLFDDASEELDEDWNCSKNRRDSDNSAFSVDGGSDFSGMPTSSSGGSSSGSSNLPEFGWRLLGESNLLFVPSVALVVVFVARTFVIPGAVSGRLLYVKETRASLY